MFHFQTFKDGVSFRILLRMTRLPSLLIAALTIFTTLAPAVPPIPDDLKTGGFAVGCQAWTFNKFTVFEAIEKTQQAGGKVIEFFPGQKLSPAEPGVKFDHNAAPEVWEKVKAKAKAHGVTPIAYGVVGLSKDEAESRRVFEFAKAMGLRVLNTESIDALDTAEKLAKEYDIQVGVHEHPKRPDDPSYRLWDPNFVLSLIKDRDPRIGACADTGHWVRSGLKPVECLQILKGRLVSSHLKDLHAPLPSGHDVPYGTGISDVSAILAEFRAQGFTGPISVEYEYKWEDNVGDAKLCIDYVRAAGMKQP